MAKKQKKTGLEKRDEMRKILGLAMWDEFGIDLNAKFRPRQPPAHALLLVLFLLTFTAVWGLAASYLVKYLLLGGPILFALAIPVGYAALILWVRFMLWARNLELGPDGKIRISPTKWK